MLGAGFHPTLVAQEAPPRVLLFLEPGEHLSPSLGAFRLESVLTRGSPCWARLPWVKELEAREGDPRTGCCEALVETSWPQLDLLRARRLAF